MTTAQKVINALLGLGLVVLAFGVFAEKPQYQGAGAYEALQTWFGNGIYAGLEKQFTIDSDGDISSTADATFGDLTVNGLHTHSPAVTATTTTGTAATLTEADLLAAQYFTVNLNAAADFTYTLPASSTLDSFVANTGESARVCFNNATTAAGIDLVFAAGAGIDLETATGTSAVEMVGPADLACLDFYRKANTDLHALFWAFDDSD